MKIKAVLMDMDGLMLDTEGVSARAWQAAAKAYGYELPWDIVIQCIGKNFTDTTAVLKKHLSINDLTAIGRLKHSIKDHVIADQGLKVMDGCIELLTMLRESQIQVLVVTSTDRDRALTVLDDAGILGFFNSLVCGGEVAIGKPHPGIYLEAVKRAGCLPEECIAFEDSPAGVLSASGAGVLTFAVPNLAELPDNARMAAYKILSSLCEAPDEINKLSGE